MEKTKEEHRADRREYYRANKESIKETNKRWRARNKEMVKATRTKINRNRPVATVSAAYPATRFRLLKCSRCYA